MIDKETVEHNGEQIALILRKNLKVDGLEFFTQQDNPFQVGIHNRPKGLKLSPHFHHLDKPLIIDTIQEILIVQKGKIRITFYSSDSKVITKKILGEGDSILLMSEGHGVDFLQDSQVLEIKQGPYPGPSSAKIYIHLDETSNT